MPLDAQWQKARQILARELNIELAYLKDEHLLREDLEIDSIVALNLIFSFEKELGITLTEEHVVGLKRVGDLKGLLATLTHES